MVVNDSSLRALMQASCTMHHVRILLDGLAKEGFDTLEFERIVTSAGRDPQRMGDRVSLLLWATLWYLAEARMEDEAIAFRIARHIDLGSWEMLGYLAASQATVMDAMQASAKLAASTHDMSRAAFEETEQGMYVYLDMPPGIPVLPCLMDFAVASCVNSGRLYLRERFSPLRVHLARPRPRRTAAWTEFFGCPVHFDAAKTGVLLPHPVLDRKLPTADPVLREVLSRQAEQELAPPPQRDVVQQTVSAITTNIESHGVPTLATVAKRLGTSTRTLRRRLGERDVSFSQLVADTRRDLAMRYLEGQELSLDDIADRLDFANASAFHRAFKRWTNKTPGQYRRECDSGDGAGFA